MSQKPTLLLPTEYVSDAAKHIRQATKRVSFLSMVLADDDASDELIDALADAAERGVNVELAADMFTYAELGGFFFPTQYKTRQSRASTRMSKRFTKAGVKFTWLGRAHAMIFSGRTHIKWCIVDDTVYSFGGVNLYQKGIENNDFMFKVTDSELADKLVDEYHRLARADAGNYAYRSHSFPYANHHVLIDGGLFGDSIIYRRVCKLASEASHILLVTQYCPTGRLSRILKQKHADVYFNSPEHASGLNRFVIKLGMLTTRLRSNYTQTKYLHAKFMIFTMPDGKRIAITGSHNFSSAGVLLGTREVALQTSDPHIIDQLDAFYDEHVA